MYLHEPGELSFICLNTMGVAYIAPILWQYNGPDSQVVYVSQEAGNSFWYNGSFVFFNLVSSLLVGKINQNVINFPEQVFH